MMQRVRHSGKLSKIVQTDNRAALFASMIAVFYDDAVMANGYGGAARPTLQHCARSPAS